MRNIRILKRLLISGLLLATSGTALAADVGVSISVGQPGFYGRIDIGDYPYPVPRVIYSRPIMVHRHVDVYEPLYLRVPPGHAKNWSRYCGRYDACDYPVYFVQDSWYRNEYVPIYRERYYGNNSYNRGHGGDRDGRYERDDRGDHYERGNNHGKGNGHGNSKGRD